MSNLKMRRKRSRWSPYGSSWGHSAWSVLVVALTSAAMLGALAGCRSAAAEKGDIEGALAALNEYLELLNQKEYERAEAFTADDPDFWQGLRDNNPAIDPDDRAGLLKNACELQGVCLAVREVLSAQQVSATEFVFIVEFSNPDGTLFVRGPCCGGNATDFPPETEFEYRVVKEGDSFLVFGGPIYLP